jgi:hypothetical protein
LGGEFRSGSAAGCLDLMATTATARARSSQARTSQRQAVASVERAIRAVVRPPRSRYLHEFAEAFRSYQAQLTDADVLARACAADIILIGDYHSLPSCQKFAASILRHVAAQDRRPNVLGLEAAYSTSQPVLDEWFRGGIDDNELPQRLNFAHDWGYDWEPYRELFRVVQQECEAVWGLDSEPRYDLRRVRGRDRHIAAKIQEMRRLHPDARLVVFIGESHLAPQHLPRLLREALPGEQMLTVLQNVDALYWQLAESFAQHPPPVSVAEDVVCVFNSAPLEKYESYQRYLECWSR